MYAQINLSLPPGEMSRSDREGWNQLTWLFRFALIRICQCAALSVICFANASSPKGRAKKPVQAESLTNQGDFDTNLFVCCSFRHGLRRATFLREEGFGFPRKSTCLSLWERCKIRLAFLLEVMDMELDKSVQVELPKHGIAYKKVSG